MNLLITFNKCVDFIIDNFKIYIMRENRVGNDRRLKKQRKRKHEKRILHRRK